MRDFILHARNRSRAGKEFLAILEEHDAIANGHQVITDQGHTVSWPPGTARPYCNKTSAVKPNQQA
jgi:hypothetical protein